MSCPMKAGRCWARVSSTHTEQVFWPNPEDVSLASSSNATCMSLEISHIYFESCVAYFTAASMPIQNSFRTLHTHVKAKRDVCTPNGSSRPSQSAGDRNAHRPMAVLRPLSRVAPVPQAAVVDNFLSHRCVTPEASSVLQKCGA
jgi:hypothetical protein